MADATPVPADQHRLIDSPQDVSDVLYNRDEYIAAKGILGTLGIVDADIVGLFDAKVVELNDQAAEAIKAYADAKGETAPPFVTDGDRVYSIDTISGKPHLDLEIPVDAIDIPLPGSTPTPVPVPDPVPTPEPTPVVPTPDPTPVDPTPVVPTPDPTPVDPTPVAPIPDPAPVDPPAPAPTPIPNPMPLSGTNNTTNPSS